MPQTPTPGGGQNQTLLELIYSLKGLAQTVEFLHQDLSRKLDDESKARARELDRFRELIGKNTQALAVLPITFSDRVEKFVGKVEEDVSQELENVRKAIERVTDKLEGYSRTAERAISQNEATAAVEAIEQAHEHGDVTGRLEVTKEGGLRMEINSTWLKKFWYVLLVLAAGGGVFGIKEVIKALFLGE
jgi:hypothetical protein